MSDAPITPVIEQQRQARLQAPPRLGKIRMGHRDDKGQVVVPTTWRFTSPSRGYINQVADRWGGDVEPWGNQWAVNTEADELELHVWPGDIDGLSTWRLWGRSGLTRECDGSQQTDGKRCMCDSDEKARHAARDQCSLETTVQFMLPDIGGWGVWWLVTGSKIAAQEVGFQYRLLLSHAQRTGELIPVKLGKRFIEHGSKHYAVPELRIEVPLREVLPPSTEGGALRIPTVEAQSLPAPTVGSLPASTPGGRDESPGSGVSPISPAPVAPVHREKRPTRGEVEPVASPGTDGGADGEQETGRATAVPAPSRHAPSHDAIAEFLTSENPVAGTNDEIETRTRRLYELMADAGLWKPGALHKGLAKYIDEHEDVEPKRPGEIHYGDLARKRHMQAFAVRSFEAAERKIGG